MDHDVAAAMDRIRAYLSNGNGTTAPYLRSAGITPQRSAVAPVDPLSVAVARGAALGMGVPPSPKSALKKPTESRRQEQRQQQPAISPVGGSSSPLEELSSSKDVFLHVVAYLRERYGDYSPSTPLAELSDEDLEGLANAFLKDLRKESGRSSVVVHAPPRTAKGGDQETLVSSARDAHPTPRALVTSQQSISQSAALTPRVPRTIKEAMGLLREGCWVTKFSRAKGAPARRYVCVQYQRALFRGDMMSIPHFCWSAAPDDEPSGACSLFSLRDAVIGPSKSLTSTLSTRSTDGAASIHGIYGEMIDPGQCLALNFGTRTVDMAFPSVAHCCAWEASFSFIIARNQRL